VPSIAAIQGAMEGEKGDKLRWKRRIQWVTVATGYDND
jgi:hypothetical protein